ncbi:MAG: hypothetical protein J7J44_00780 [Deltaproteobacteria bacterium]|nr:hypothetical protein [Deltaproteobacteria bacterium]
MISWLWQRFSGIGLLVLLFIHLDISHLQPLSYKGMQVHTSSPPWIFFDLCLLGLSISHGLNGLWQIGQEYILNKDLRRVLAFCLWSTGCLLFILGLLILFR